MVVLAKDDNILNCCLALSLGNGVKVMDIQPVQRRFPAISAHRPMIYQGRTAKGRISLRL